MALLGELDYVLLSQPSTAFAGIIPDVTVEEVPRDALVITQHPVERGAAIADHAYKLPVILEVRAGFSNASEGAEGYAEAVYADLIQLQAVREPFDVFTPRRLYPNMLIRSVVAPRDERTGTSLFVSIIFEEIILTSTRQASSGTGARKPGDQAAPSSTQGTTDGGTRQLEPPLPGTDGFGATFGPGSLDGTTGSLAPDGLTSPPGGEVSLGEIQFGDGTTLPADPGFNAPMPTTPGFSIPGQDGYFGDYAGM